MLLPGLYPIGMPVFPRFKLRHPRDFQANHIPKGNLVKSLLEYITRNLIALRPPSSATCLQFVEIPRVIEVVMEAHKADFTATPSIGDIVNVSSTICPHQVPTRSATRHIKFPAGICPPHLHVTGIMWSFGRLRFACIAMLLIAPFLRVLKLTRNVSLILTRWICGPEQRSTKQLRS